MNKIVNEEEANKSGKIGRNDEEEGKKKTGTKYEGKKKRKNRKN